jgi:acyl-CoA oxidase
MNTWHCEKTARICRERCGGGSYLSYNGVCEVLKGAHSGMTAEGDNSVLM